MYRIVTWDLDSTLADSRHRADFINPNDRENTDWVAYGNLADADTPTSLAETFRNFRDMGILNIIVTSRPLPCIGVTSRWLEENDLQPAQLIMQPTHSTKSSAEWKVDVLRDIEKAYNSPVMMHFDDWWDVNQNIENKLGIPTVTVRVYDPREIELVM